MVIMTDFWMAETEVTQRQYRDLIGSNPANFQKTICRLRWSVGTMRWRVLQRALSVKEKLQPCYQISGDHGGDGQMDCSARDTDCRPKREWEYAANPATPPRTICAALTQRTEWHGTAGNAANTTHTVKTKTANGKRFVRSERQRVEWVWDHYQSTMRIFLDRSDRSSDRCGLR